MKLLSVILFFLYGCTTCLAQKAMSDNEHIRLLADFVRTSVDFNAKVDSFFSGKSREKKQYYFMEKILNNDSVGTLLKTRHIPDSARKSIVEGRKKRHFICQISEDKNSFFMCVYSLSNRALRGYPVLFCNFSMYYSITPEKRINIIRFDQRIVM